MHVGGEEEFTLADPECVLGLARLACLFLWSALVISSGPEGAGTPRVPMCERLARRGCIGTLPSHMCMASLTPPGSLLSPQV